MNCSEHQDTEINNLNNKILLMGPPNVGKSVFFNLMTGLNVSMANYAGTTVAYTAGTATLSSGSYPLIDVPGTYTLNATNQAEEVAVKMLDSNPAAIICVVDASNLESSLYLLLQILERGIPTVVALNRSDLAAEKGYIIDTRLLTEELKLPVIPTVAITGEGLEELKKEAEEIISSPRKRRDKKTPPASWQEAERLTQLVQKRESTSDESTPLGDLLVQPWPGLPLAGLGLLLIFGLVIGLGMGLRQFFLLPLFTQLLLPLIEGAVIYLVPEGLIQRILIGDYGFLIKGIEWPFALVMPYVLSFYLALSLMEDSGYLPRLGILLDGLLNRIGMRGSNIIPLLLGYGCGIPGILATRALSSKKERIMISLMISLAVPCIAQSGAFISLLAEKSITVVIAVFMLSFLALAAAGFMLDLILPGSTPITLEEIPDLLPPRKEVLFKKLWIRFKNFIFDGALPMVGAVAVAAVLYETGIMVMLGSLMSPLVAGWLKLPQEAAGPLLLGIMRRELAVLPLLEMELTTIQLFTGAVVALFYVPCIAMIATLAREFSLKMSIIVLLFTTSSAFLLGGVIAQFFSFLPL